MYRGEVLILQKKNNSDAILYTGSNNKKKTSTEMYTPYAHFGYRTLVSDP